MQGPEVERVQRMLRLAGFDIEVDGAWGSKTETAFNAAMDNYKHEIAKGNIW